MLAIKMIKNVEKLAVLCEFETLSGYVREELIIQFHGRHRMQVQVVLQLFGVQKFRGYAESIKRVGLNKYEKQNGT